MNRPAAAWLCAGLLAVLVAVAGSACSVGSDSEDAGPRIEVTLRAHSVAGRTVGGPELDRAVAVLRSRLEHAGIDATVARGRGSGLVVIGLDRTRPGMVDRAIQLSTTRGLLELYDLEANLVSASIDANGFPIAAESLYDLLSGRQSQVREDETDSWYLFDSRKQLAGGPAPTKRLLLPSGKLLDGWRILGTPSKTVVLECGMVEAVCPGVGIENPRRDFHYLIRHDPPRAPELDGRDVKPEGTRSDFDTVTGEPIVTMQFTEAGAARFTEITAREARRGKRLAETSLSADPALSFQHFAIVLDRRIKSWPSIDWQAYPSGIGGNFGVQITGIFSLAGARNLATALQTGALPVRFEVVSRRASGG